MEEIVDILVRRDGISDNEAWNIVEDCKAEILDALDNGAGITEVEDIMADYLGLEPDYIINLLG